MAEICDFATHSTALYVLVRKNMKSLYEASGMGWNAKLKKAEMADPELVYYSAGSSDSPGAVAAFVSFMHSQEDGRDVVYLYEMQVSREHQGRGLGSQLMQVVVDEAARSNKPVLLTVFKQNRRALAFYVRHGFLEYPELGVPAQSSGRVRGWIQLERPVAS